MTAADLNSAAALDRASSLSPWSEAQFGAELEKSHSRFWVARDGSGGCAAFAGVWLVGEEAQIPNIAVRPDCRRQGLARRLLRRIVQEAGVAGARRVTLEVREGNAAARRLYETEGFRETSRRPRFYEGAETALLLEKELL